MALISPEDLGRIVEQLKGAGYSVVKEERDKRVIWDETYFRRLEKFQGKEEQWPE